jgi:hypothetical protein
MSTTRVSRTAKKALLAMLKKGARTVKELIVVVEGEKARNTRDLYGRIRPTRMNSYFRTLKNLKRSGLVTMKYYFQFSYYIPYYRGRFFCAFKKDCSWYGWYLVKRPRDFSCVYGLTSKGKKVALEYRRELERLIEEWQPFL